MNGLIGILSAKEISAVIFAGGVVFSVGALELFSRWLQRNPGERRAAIIAAAILGAIFLAQIGCGLAVFLATGHATFLSLGLFLTGAAAFGPLLDLMIRFRAGDAGEMRRVVARDL